MKRLVALEPVFGPTKEAKEFGPRLSGNQITESGLAEARAQKLIATAEGKDVQFTLKKGIELRRRRSALCLFVLRRFSGCQSPDLK